MYIVYRWFRDDGEDYTDIIGVFPDEVLAERYIVFYAMCHMISVDDLVIGLEKDCDLNELIERGSK